MDKFKVEMEEVFEMTNLGDMSYFLGMEKYAMEILKKFKMEECKPTTTPMNQKEKFCKEDGVEKVNEELYRSMIGCLMYLTATRPDIVHVVSLLSRYMHCASEIHLQAAKRIVRYIKGTIDFGIKFKQVQNFHLHGFSDSVISWCSKNRISWHNPQLKQSTFFLLCKSSTLDKKVLVDLNMEQTGSTQVFVDS
ncbi:hypothetical protein AAG906_016071 [Vitis piasezkii]